MKSALSSTQIQYAKETQQFKVKIEAERRKSAILERETALSYAKKVQNAQNLEIERLIHDKMKSETHVRALEAKNYLLEKEIEKAHASLEQALGEVENLKNDLNERQNSAENDESTRKLINERERQMNDRCKALEERLEKVSRELRFSEERNYRYEKGYGFSEAIIHQKRLEADIRRREIDLKKLLVEVGEKDDKISRLARTCKLLQEQHTGESDVNMEAINKIIEEEQTAIFRQNRELRQQVADLEKERNSLMGRLRENALLVGGNGLRLHGLSSEKIDLVIDFVKNLKNGRVQLPLDDKSSKLASELSLLETIRQSDIYTIKRLEREIDAMRIAQDQSAKDFLESCDFVYLKNAVQEIQAQNEELKSEISQLRNTSKDGCVRDETSFNIELFTSLREKIEVIIGREVEENVDVCAILNLMYDAYDAVRKDYENTDLQLRTQELAISDYRQEIMELQTRLSNADVVSKEMKSIHVQVNIDQIELKMMQFALRTSERNLLSCGNRVKRLQKQLELRDKIIGDKSRMMVAHTVVKELKACLAKKNVILAKYRTKSISDQTAASDVKEKESLSSCTPRCCHTRSSNEELPALSTLVTKITRFAEVINEKDSIIGKLREQVSNLSVKEKVRECYHKSVQDQLSNLIREKETMLCHSHWKYEQLEKEKKKVENLLEDAEQRNSAKHKETESLSEAVSRLTKCLKSKKSEEIDRLSATELELRRTKTYLSLERRAKEKFRRILKESETKSLKAREEVEKLRSEVLELRKALNDVKGAKLLLDRKYRRCNERIQEMKVILDDKCCDKDKKPHQNDYVSQKSIISSLKKENSRLRGIIASFKIKGKVVQETSDTKDSMECCTANKGETKKISRTVKTFEDKKVESVKDEIRILKEIVVMDNKRLGKIVSETNSSVEEENDEKVESMKKEISKLQRIIAMDKERIEK